MLGLEIDDEDKLRGVVRELVDDLELFHVILSGEREVDSVVSLGIGEFLDLSLVLVSDYPRILALQLVISVLELTQFTHDPNR